MKNFLRVMQTTLRAALWRSTAVERSVSVFTVLAFATLAMASEAARQYLTVDGPAAFSIDGINSIIAAMAVFVAIASLFISKDRAVVLAQQLAALVTLLEWMLIAASRVPLPVYNPLPGIWTELGKGVLVTTIVLVWWIGAVATVFRGAGIGLIRARCCGPFGCVRWQEQRSSRCRHFRRFSAAIPISHRRQSRSGATQNCPSFQRTI